MQQYTPRLLWAAKAGTHEDAQRPNDVLDERHL
jgi:hypothetical protein